MLNETLRLTLQELLSAPRLWCLNAVQVDFSHWEENKSINQTIRQHTSTFSLMLQVKDGEEAKTKLL